MLDHILIYKGSNMGNSHRHAHVKVPVILVGGIDGTFKGNRHIVFPDDTPENVEHASEYSASVWNRAGKHRSKLRPASGPCLK